MNGLVALGVALVAATLLGALHRHRNGRLRHTDGREDLRALIPSSGERATLVQFSSAFCAPCRATKRILRDVADVVPGVSHVEIDAESNLDLVRRLNILKTPTTLVLDAGGREVLRASGQPSKHAVLNALGHAVES